MCKCHFTSQKRFYTFAKRVVKSGKLLGCKLFTETVSSFVFYSFLLESHKIAQIWQGFHLCVKQMLLLF